MYVGGADALLDPQEGDRARTLVARKAGRSGVIIYDYVDDGVPVLARMHQKRLTGYRAMGYAVASGIG